MLRCAALYYTMMRCVVVYCHVPFSSAALRHAGPALPCFADMEFFALYSTVFWRVRCVM